MRYLFTGGNVLQNSCFHNLDVAVVDGHIVSISKSIPRDGFQVVQLNDSYLVPGFVDVHIHLREPGFCYKETISTGTKAAAAGGYTTVFSMPNLNPAPDSLEHLNVQLDAIATTAAIEVLPYGCITKGQRGEELADLEAMAPYVGGFSDDGRGVQSPAMMERAMVLAKSLDKPIVAHCEDNTLLNGGCIHHGTWAKKHNFPGISSQSEWKQVERDLKLVERTGCQYHVCHISTMETVELIRRAKAKGLAVTCETAPHYLCLCEDDLLDEGRFKMNPPLRSRNDKEALIAGLVDGTIDCIATDHAPHSAEEKSHGLLDSAMGIVGLETAFPVLYTDLVSTGIMTLEKLVEKLTVNPRKIFHMPPLELTEGAEATFTILSGSMPHMISSDNWCTLGRASPFIGKYVTGAVVKTVSKGTIVYEREER